MLACTVKSDRLTFDTVSCSGVPLMDGGTVRLQKLIGLSRALDITLTGRPVQGEEAYTMGLANRLCTTGTGQFSVLMRNRFLITANNLLKIIYKRKKKSINYIVSV